MPLTCEQALARMDTATLQVLDAYLNGHGWDSVLKAGLSREANEVADAVKAELGIRVVIDSRLACAVDDKPTRQ